MFANFLLVSYVPNVFLFCFGIFVAGYVFPIVRPIFLLFSKSFPVFLIHFLFSAMANCLFPILGISAPIVSLFFLSRFLMF